MSARLITMAVAALALTLPITSQAQQPGTASQMTSQNSSQPSSQRRGDSQMQVAKADQQYLQQLQQVNQRLVGAGYILDINGYGDGCRSVVQAVQRMQQRFTTAAATGDTEFRDRRNR